MVDLKLLEKNLEGSNIYYNEYVLSLKSRGYSSDGLEKLILLNKKRKEAITESENAKANLNKLSQDVGKLKRDGKDVTSVLQELSQLSGRVKELEYFSARIDEEVYQLALTLPNKCHFSVPPGSSSNDNKIVKSVGTPTSFSFVPKEHGDLGEKLGILDFERAAKVAGARFTFLKGPAAQLERALIQFFMDYHSQKHGYTEMIPPFIVNHASYVGTGQFPKFKEDVFQLSDTDYYLISTAEVPVTNYFRDEILKEDQLPLSFCAYSPCFRSEAGSHGKDTKGLIRQHQFNKVELMIFSHPQNSYEFHEKLTSHAEQILVELELPFRRMLLCAGDMSFSAAKCYDLEVWLPGSNTYREISSCSNFEDFQARRSNIRFRPTDNKSKPQYVHTINGSGLAIGRTLIAILENYQTEEGTIRVPLVLQKYLNGLTEIKKI